jgi:hypothetical protein
MLLPDGRLSCGLCLTLAWPAWIAAGSTAHGRAALPDARGRDPSWMWVAEPAGTGRGEGSEERGWLGEF